MVVNRISRKERKHEILRVLREKSDRGGNAMTCRQIAHAMNMRGFSYINSLLQEMCDDGVVSVNVHKSNKAISSVRFEYYV